MIRFLTKRREFGLGRWPLLVLIAAAAYWLVAPDLIPDSTPILGVVDDVVVTALLLILTNGKP